jgi:hypothetical protein
LHAAGEYAVDHERSSITGGWRPLPGKLDLHIGKRPHRWAAEAKVWDIGQQIWDALKLVAGIRHSDLETGYLLAAAPPTAFAHYGGGELYAPGRHVHDVRELIVRNATDWEHDLGGGRGRPEELPSEIVTTLLVDEWCWFGHRLRLVRVALANQASIAPLRFDAGWPVGVDPAVAIATAKARPRRTMFDALGLAVPARWSDAWWRDRVATARPDQFEALYGLLLTRGWTDLEIRERVVVPEGWGPEWW